MPEKDYSHRDVVDKLGIKPGHAVVFATEMDRFGNSLCQRILQRTGRPAAREDEPADVVVALLEDAAVAIPLLKRWKVHLKPTGGIWLLTHKRGHPGYVDQRELIAAGKEAGLVDNKVCSVSDDTSAMRFVIRKADR